MRRWQRISQLVLSCWRRKALMWMIIGLLLPASCGIKEAEVTSMEWSKTFGGPGWDLALSVQQTSNGGYIVAGWTYSFGAGVSDFWLIKVGK